MSWVRFSLRTRDTWHYVKRVSQRSPERRGFSPGTPVSSNRECWQGGLGLAPNWPFHLTCAPWSDMSRMVAARGALRKPSTCTGVSEIIGGWGEGQFPQVFATVFNAIFLWMWSPLVSRMLLGYNYQLIHWDIHNANEQHILHAQLAKPYLCSCSFLPDQKAVLMFMLKSRVASLPGHIQSVYVQNILKLYSYIMAKAEDEV
jgi:hypothetical protein